MSLVSKTSDKSREFFLVEVATLILITQFPHNLEVALVYHAVHVLIAESPGFCFVQSTIRVDIIGIPNGLNPLQDSLVNLCITVIIEILNFKFRHFELCFFVLFDWIEEEGNRAHWLYNNLSFSGILISMTNTQVIKP